MALLLQHKDDNYHWAVWKVEETVEDLLSLLPRAEEYRREAGRFSSVHRRLEWCAVRVLLYAMLGGEKEVLYRSSGKPYLADASRSLSISHTRGYVAVILGRPDAEVGIDIEQYGERVHKVSGRFMRTDERAACYKGTDTWGLLLHWSAKETMFKCLNADEVDFREHLRIFPFDVSSGGEFAAVECRTAYRRRFLIHYSLHPDFVLTYTCLPSALAE